jgi:Flp pilus assembly protein TadG
MQWEMVKRSRVSGTRRRAAAAVEFALALPVLMLVILGCVDFGRFTATYIAVTSAGSSGATFGANNPVTSGTQALWEAQIRERVADDMRGLIDGDSRFGESDLKVNAQRLADPGNFWRVRVEVEYPFAMLVRWPGLPSQMQISRAVEMRGVR